MPLDNAPRTSGKIAVTALGATVPVFIGTEEIRQPRIFINEQNSQGDTIIAGIVGIGWAGTLTSITVYINDLPLPADVQLTVYLATTNQGIDPTIAAAIPGYAETMIITEGVTTPVPLGYFVLKIPQASEIAGAPKITAIVDAGSASPVEYYAAFLRSEIWGKGRSVNQASIDAQITINNEQIGGENRHTLNKLIEKRKNMDAMAEELEGYAGVFTADDGDEIYLVPNRPAASAVTLTDNELIRGSIRPRGIPPGPTVVIVKFTNAATIPHSEDEIRVELAGVDTGAVPNRTTTISAGGVTVKQAQRIGLRALKRTELITTAWQFRLGDEGLKYRRGTVATISSEIEKLDPLEVRITAVPEPSIGRFQYEAETYHADIYTDDISGVVVTYNPTVELPNSIDAPAVSSVQSFFETIEGAVTYYVKAIITPPADIHFARIYAEASLDGGATWRRMPERENSTTAWLQNLKDGTTVQVRARAENTFRVKSDWSAIVSGIVDATPAPPPAPTSVNGYGRSDGSREISIGQPPLPTDYNNTSIRYSTFATGGWNEAGPRQDTRDDRTMDGFNIPSGTYYIQAINYDNGGRASAEKVAGPFDFGDDKEAVTTGQNTGITNADTTANTANLAARYQGNAFSNLYPQIEGDISTADGKGQQGIDDAETAQSTASTALSNANAALTQAGLKARVVHSYSRPSVTSGESTLWINLNTGGASEHWDGSTWRTADMLYTDAVTATHINVSSLSAIQAVMGVVTSGRIEGLGGGYIDFINSPGTRIYGAYNHWDVTGFGVAEFEQVFTRSRLDCLNGTVDFGNANRFEFNPYQSYVYGGGFSGDVFYVSGGAAASWLRTAIRTVMTNAGYPPL